MGWDEIDVEILGRLMIAAIELDGELDDLGVSDSSEDTTEAIYDARYHAHKLAKIISSLAVRAERERRQAEEANREPVAE